MHCHPAPPVRSDHDHRPIRLPGLFRLNEVEDALTRGGEFALVRAGRSDDGLPLFAAYYRPRPPSRPTNGSGAR